MLGMQMLANRNQRTGAGSVTPAVMQLLAQQRGKRNLFGI